MLVVNVVAAPTAEELEAEGAGEAAEEAEGEAAPRAKRVPRARSRRGRRRGGRRRILRVGGVSTAWPSPYWWSAWAIPGRNYATTRHNLGFLVADILADRMGAEVQGAQEVRGRGGDRPGSRGRSVVLAKPRCYMNESGRQVGPLAKFYSVAPADIVIDPRRARHRVRPDPAEVRRRRRRPQRAALGGVSVGHQRLSAGPHRHRPPAGPQDGRVVRAGELHRRRAARGSDHLRAGRRRDRIACRPGPGACPEHRARLEHRSRASGRGSRCPPP